MPTMHAPPAGLTELQQTPNGLTQWDAFVGGCIEASTSAPGGGGGQFVPQFPPGAGPIVELPVYWNAFPKSLLSRFGRERAMVLADMLWPVDELNSIGGPPSEFDPSSVFFARDRRHLRSPLVRPHNEYCEWRVERYAPTHEIERVVFTAETPEYWWAMFGGDVRHVGGSVRFAGNADSVVGLYRQLAGPDGPACPADLLQPGTGVYDPLNRWNTTHGIVHASHPANRLAAAINLCADSTLLFAGPSGPLTVPEAVCCALGSADTGRASDLTVIGTGNALARQGARLALAEPVGIYIDHVDTSGWELPGVADASACCRIVRGQRGHVLRMTVEAPAGAGCRLNELTIGGEPLAHGGQIAECVTMRASLLALTQWQQPGPSRLAQAQAQAQGYVLPSSPALLQLRLAGAAAVAGSIPVFRS